MTVWTEERVKIATALWVEGHSAAQIKIKLDCGFTRNAIVGKLHRLGLKRTGERAKPPRVRKRIDGRPPAPLFASQPLPPDPPPVAAATALKSIMELKDDTCKCPIGDPKAAGFGFCGLPTRTGSPYCCAHHPLMYSEIRTKRARRNGDRGTLRMVMPKLDQGGEYYSALLRAA